MRTRKPGMWWGTAIEAPDPGALARFYADLLEWPVVHEEPGVAVVAVAEAVGLGATVAHHQPQPHVRVMVDPAGHPFCLCHDDG